MVSHCGHLHYAVNFLPTYMYTYSQTFNPLSPKVMSINFLLTMLIHNQERINKTIT